MIIHCENIFGDVWVVAPCPLGMVLSFHEVNRRGNELADEIKFCAA